MCSTLPTNVDQTHRGKREYKKRVIRNTLSWYKHGMLRERKHRWQAQSFRLTALYSHAAET